MIEEEIISEFKKDIKKSHTAFLVGAGVSIPVPSNIRALPQKDCLKTISDLDPEKINKLIHAVRPEVFFQVLYNVIGKRALNPLEIINPKFLNSEEKLVSPNLIHYFLAERIEKGHVVITTNLDCLIEEAYENITNGKELNVVLYENDYIFINRNIDKLNSGILIKFHGSFYDSRGEDSRDTIRVILEQVQIEFPEFKRQLLTKLINDYDFVVLGYSGRDDYDLFTYLLNPPSNRKIWWIKHFEDQNPNEWSIISTEQLKDKNKKIGALPISERTPDDWEVFNASSIVLAYSFGKYISPHTKNFIDRLNLRKDSESLRDPSPKLNEKIDTYLKKWAISVNKVERNEILANLFETLGGNYLNEAQNYLEKASQLKSSSLEAIKLLNFGRISYKKGDFKTADAQLQKAVKIFERLDSISGQADCYQYLALVSIRLKSVDSGREYGEKAVNFYLQQEKYFEVAQMLRGLALIAMTGIPDIYMIEDLSEKNRCVELLEEAKNLCTISLKILRKIGNKTGERGENQSLNLLGLIYLRLGKFEKAKEFFEEFLNLSGRSRFIRESSQAYRNLALVLMNLSKINIKNKNEYIDKSLECYRFSLLCLGIDPTDNLFEPLNREQFLTRFYRSEAFLERSNKNDLEFALKDLKILQKVVCNVFNTKEIWHWNCNLLFQYYLAKSKEFPNNKSEIIDLLERLIKEYEQQDDSTFEKLPFGIGNAKENLRYLIYEIEKMEVRDSRMEHIYKKIKNLLERISNLKTNLPPTLHKDWSRIISKLNEKYNDA